MGSSDSPIRVLPVTPLSVSHENLAPEGMMVKLLFGKTLLIFSRVIASSSEVNFFMSSKL